MCTQTLKIELILFQTRFCWEFKNIAMCKPYRYFEWRAVFSVNMPEVRVFSTLFVMSCSFVINDFLSVMEVYTQKMERKQRQNISMLKWFSLNLSFKHYTAKSLWKAHRDSAVLFYLKVLQTVGSVGTVWFLELNVAVCLSGTVMSLSLI